MYSIYTVTHKVSRRIYVGVTSNPTLRWEQHRFSGQSTIIGDVIKADGIHKFRFRVIETIADRRTAYAREQYWIAYYRGMRRGLYNPINKGNKHPTANLRYLL